MCIVLKNALHEPVILKGVDVHMCMCHTESTLKDNIFAVSGEDDAALLPVLYW